ncbi:MAG: MmcQ/YjbR family DNA-binding protein [Marinoscillum sp.]
MKIDTSGLYLYMTNQDFVNIALSFPGTVEHPHFDRRAFKVEKKRIFTTLHESTHSANVKLTKSEQIVFCEFGSAIYPVPNKWGEQGWTTIELPQMEEGLVMEILNSAYNDLFSK